MNDLEAVIRYEKSRKLVSDLNKKKSELISKCEYIEPIGFNCFAAAYTYVNEEEDDDISYEDSFMIYINDGKGACESCIEASAIKYGKLAEAKKEFGAAKRALSALGKKLIKEL